MLGHKLSQCVEFPGNYTRAYSDLIDQFQETGNLVGKFIGEKCGRAMVASMVQGIDEMMQIVDEASQIIEYSRQLEEKSDQLEQALNEIEAANLRLLKLHKLNQILIAKLKEKTHDN